MSFRLYVRNITGFLLRVVCCVLSPARSKHKGLYSALIRVHQGPKTGPFLDALTYEILKGKNT